MSLSPSSIESFEAFTAEAAAAEPVSRASATRQRASIRSQDLLHGCRELLIHHGQQEYRLRLTQNDKLILTK